MNILLYIFMAAFGFCLGVYQWSAMSYTKEIVQLRAKLLVILYVLGAGIIILVVAGAAVEFLMI